MIIITIIINQSDKYNSNSNNNQDNFNSNDTKNDNNYNNKLKFNHNDNWDNSDNNNNKDNFNSYENKDSNDNNNNNVTFYGNDNKGNNNVDNNYNYNSNDNKGIKNEDNTTTTANNNIDSNDNNNLRTSKQQKRNIIWFNPLFSKNVATKIGRYFLNPIDKHFSRDHKFHKTFNRNNIKVSYSCLPNIKSTIKSHNNKIFHPPVNNQSRTCNCINKTDCLLQEKCLSKNAL